MTQETEMTAPDLRDQMAMAALTVLDPSRSAWDVAHDPQRFRALGLSSETVLAKLAEGATEIAGYGCGNEAAAMRFAMLEITRLRAMLSERNRTTKGEDHV